MMYLLIFIVLGIFGILNLVWLPKEQAYLKDIGLISSFFILVLFAGLRYQTGPDWKDYNDFFSGIAPLYDYGQTSIAIRDVLEPGFVFLCSLFKAVINNNQFVFLGLAAVSLSFFFSRIKEYSAFPLISILCFYIYGYSGNFSILRQVMAISIFFWAVKYIVNRNPFAYYGAVILAFLFHTSAIILLPLYFVINIRWSGKLIMFFFLIAIILYQFDIVSQLFSYLLSSVGGLARYSDYLTNQLLSKPKLLGTLFLERMLIFVLLFYKRNGFEKQYKYFNVFFNIYIIYILCYLVFSQVLVLLRFIEYFTYASCILYPLLLLYFKESYGRYIVYMFLFIILFFRGYTSLVLDGKEANVHSRYLPYRSIIEN
ncbi:EpsG family protein [Chitinophaga sp. MM2321]|uniref:EpsG family protein n=1 Tax=Chitinophaga sp. MM2321 TaxID=3137178 RepID=UPI0032D5943F